MPFLIIFLIMPTLLIEIFATYSDITATDIGSYRLTIERYLGFDATRLADFHQVYPGQVGLMFLSYPLTDRGFLDFILGGFLVMLFSAMMLDAIGGFRLVASTLAAMIGGAVGHLFLAHSPEPLTGLLPVAYGLLPVMVITLISEKRRLEESVLFPIFFAFPFAALHILPDMVLSFGPLDTVYHLLRFEANAGAVAAGILISLFFMFMDAVAGGPPKRRGDREIPLEDRPDRDLFLGRH